MFPSSGLKNIFLWNAVIYVVGHAETQPRTMSTFIFVLSLSLETGEALNSFHAT
jgi:hypothetical protein